MPRLLDWLIGPPEVRPPTVAAAGAVALAGRGRPARGSGAIAWPPGTGPQLAPFVIDGVPMLCDRDTAMSLPTVSRSRNLTCTAVAALPFTLWSLDPTTVPAVEQRLPQPTWMERPDPNRTRQWLLAWTVDDLLFHEVAHWRIAARYRSTGYPSAFERICPGDLQQRDDGVWTYTDCDTGERVEVAATDVVEFLSPIEGMLSNGYRAISIALQLDQAADRFAANEIPGGVLEEQESSEDLSTDELTAMAADFALARSFNTTAATNKHVKYREIEVDASKMQIVEGRTYQALELARLGNIPPYLVGAPAGTGMTYLNGQQARQDLIDFAAGAYIGCIEQTLSGPNVTPRGQFVRLDQNAWLRNPFTTTTDGAAAEISPNDAQIADPTTVTL